MKKVIETERLFLREMNWDDYDALYAVLADESIMEHYPYTFDEERVRAWIERNMKRYQEHGFGLWAVCLKDSGEMIGDCGLTLQNIDGKMLPEIGYHIRADQQRKGYAKEAAAAVRDWAFTHTDYPALYSYCKYTNVGSYKTAESIGMHFEKEYPDEANEYTHVSVIRREEYECLEEGVDVAVEETIRTLMKGLGLGEVISPVTPVSGGFLHRMYKVETKNGIYAVKLLNPEIMKRPNVKENYARADLLEKKLEEAGLPIVPALEINGKKMQNVGDSFFYIFTWLSGKISDWENITPEQCREAGRIQGKIHAIEPKEIPHAEPSRSEIDWAAYLADAETKGSGIAEILRENEDLLVYATESMNDARRALPDIECITDEDMDPKNVMWKDGKPYVIDLECLDYGNPANSALQLALQWAGITTCSLDVGKMDAFFEGYLELDNPRCSAFRAYEAIFGVAYTWVEWLEYNVLRALGQCQDEADRKLGESEVRNTIGRIRYIYEKEDEIKAELRKIFG